MEKETEGRGGLFDEIGAAPSPRSAYDGWLVSPGIRNERTDGGVGGIVSIGVEAGGGRTRAERLRTDRIF